MRKIFFFAAVMFAACAVSAQEVQDSLLLEEDFEYEAGTDLISNPVVSSDNLDAITGWSTQANKQADINGFKIVEGNLTYPGYPGGVYGNMLRHENTDSTGNACQTVFKVFSHGVKNDSTVYIAFLLKLDNDEATAGDFLFGIKSEPNAASTNWGGLLYTNVMPSIPGEEISFGIKKNSGSTGTWVDSNNGPFYAANSTMLVVIKYHVGVVYGNSQAEETADGGHFDDVMDLFINPDLSKGEPATPTLTRQDPSEKDICRWGSSKVFGAARAFLLRGSAKGNFPSYYIDGIRVANTWDAVMGPQATGLRDVQLPENVQKAMVDGQLVIIRNGVKYTAIGTEL